MGGDSITGCISTGVQRLPVLGKLATSLKVQLQCLRQQDAVRILSGLVRLQIQTAGDQGSVVVQRAAEFQLDLQHITRLETGRQGPTAGGIEQIPLMHEETIHPEARRFSPPAQTQPNTAAL